MASYHGGSAKTAGAVLIFMGAVILVFSIPCWLWAALAGMALIVLGILVCRFA